MNIFCFEEMFSTQIVKVVYILGLIGIAISAIIYINAVINNYSEVLYISKYLENTNQTWQMCLGALIRLGILIGGTLLWRIVCEGVIVVFSIYDQLEDIKELLKK